MAVVDNATLLGAAAATAVLGAVSGIVAIVHPADGRRPLRSLLADPAFQAAAGLDRLDETEVQGRPGPSPAQAEELQNRLAQYRAEHEVPTFPSAEVLASFASEALERAQRTRDTIAADALTGWQGSLDRPAKPGSTDGDTDSGEPPRTHA